MTGKVPKRVRSFSDAKLSNGEEETGSLSDGPSSPKRRNLSIRKPVPVLKLNNATHSFVRNTIHERLPTILDEIVSRNLGIWKEKGQACSVIIRMRLEELRKEISGKHHGGDVLIKKLDDLEDNHGWNSEHLVGVAGEIKLKEASTFFVENYFYRRVLDAVQYWESRVDPFAGQKRDMLKVARESFGKTIKTLVSRGEQSSPGVLAYEQFRAVLQFQLWGNRSDLSLSGGKVESEERGRASVALLADDTERVWVDLQPGKGEEVPSDQHKVSSGKGEKVVIVLDNCGLEILSDLICADMLLSYNIVSTVELHCKSTPVFVSDVMVDDFEYTVKWLEAIEEFAPFAKTIRKHMKDGRLKTVANDFYTSPSPYSSIPRSLLSIFQEAKLVIIKGDANYRRLLGEKQWHIGTSFEQVMDYFSDVNVLALRTLKWPLAVGIDKAGVEKAESIVGDGWDVNGRCGTIQYANKTSV